MGNQRIQAQKMTCPQCKAKLQPRQYDIGRGIAVSTKHCVVCGFNITDDKTLGTALHKLRSRMAKEVKVIAIGDGIGIRFPKEMIEEYAIKKGAKILVNPGKKRLELVL